MQKAWSTSKEEPRSQHHSLDPHSCALSFVWNVPHLVKPPKIRRAVSACVCKGKD